MFATPLNIIQLSRLSFSFYDQHRHLPTSPVVKSMSIFAQFHKTAKTGFACLMLKSVETMFYTIVWSHSHQTPTNQVQRAPPPHPTQLHYDNL